jgi:galactokinase
MATSLTTRVELLFGARCDRPPQGIEFARGRVVILGEHLDHQGGRVLAAPLEQGVACAWGVRPDSRVVVWNMNHRAKDSFHQGQWARSGRGWGDLARGACARVAEGNRRLPGMDLMVMGNLPMEEGLASSAAYLVVLLRALFTAVGVYRSRWELSEDVPHIEREWIGVHSGVMDPYVVAAAKPGQVLLVDCADLDHQVLELPAGCELTTEDMGVKRRLAETPYNERRRELEQALAAIRALRPDVERLPDLSPAAFAEIADRIADPPRRRARHVVTETERVRRAVVALEEGDAAGLGALMNEGHESLGTDFESSTPTVDRLRALALALPGVLGARLQGAGWGGRLAVLSRPADEDSPPATAR